MIYDDYDSGLPYRDYSDDIDCKTCTECATITQKFDEASDFLTGIIKQLYGIENFDREVLDQHISELCWLLDVKEPTRELTVHSIKVGKNKIFDFALNLSKELNTGNFYPSYHIQ